jgi:uncharacterized membrane protein
MMKGNEMGNFEQSVDVNVPVRTVYNQWTQFEMFPYFMEGVEAVKQISDTRLRWKTEIAGNEQTWDAEITEQTPDQRIAWKSVSGANHAGVVTFHRLDDNLTRVMLQIDYDPVGFVENVGAALGIVEKRMAGDLDRFKHFIESGGKETGAWRGTIEQNN